MGIEDKIFTRARLGRYWTNQTAHDCLRFFGERYRFDPKRERKFMETRRTQYSDNLLTMLARE